MVEEEVVEQRRLEERMLVLFWLGKKKNIRMMV